MAKLKYLVIHCTATAEGREVTAAQLRAAHTNPVSKGGRGWRVVGYTDMIHLDGRVERLVDNNEDANVDPWEITNGAKGYNTVSRHVVYVGGVEAVSHRGVERLDAQSINKQPKPKDTRTEAQKEALKRYVLDFHRRHPDVKIIGHNEVAAKDCPCFDVQKYLKEIGI